MSSKPPTRRSRHTSNGDPSLPIIPILIGVIVLGFVIGAGLSLAGRHDMTVVALASPSAAASETLAPVTPAPSEKPTPEPTAAPAQSADVPASSASVAATVPAVATTPRPPARHATPHAASSRAVSAPSAAVAAATAAPQVVRASAVATEAAVAPAAVTSDPNAASNVSNASGAGNASIAGGASSVQADSAFAKLSAAVVRQYLEAVKRGDEDGAYAALGSTPGAKDATLTEQGVVDSRTHVGRIDAHSAANDNALVSVQLQTSNGPYYGQYTVHKTETGAAVIVAHSIVKP